MIEVISREELSRRIGSEEDLPLVEVLEEKYFRSFHLPGAVNVPLDDEFDRNIQGALPDKTQPVVVYCLDEECTASTQAAQRMQQLGYQKVYDYTAGKDDWKEAGLPVE